MVYLPQYILVMDYGVVFVAKVAVGRVNLLNFVSYIFSFVIHATSFLLLAL